MVSLEDPLAEDDWSGWQRITQQLGKRVQLIGDDLFVTHLGRLSRGIRESAANAILVKPNHRGTLSQSRQVLNQAQQAGFATIVSARSGETEQGWLADLAIGWRAGQNQGRVLDALQADCEVESPAADRVRPAGASLVRRMVGPAAGRAGDR